MACRSYWTKRRRTLRILDSFEPSSVNGSDVLGDVDPEFNLALNDNAEEEDDIFMDCTSSFDDCYTNDKRVDGVISDGDCYGDESDTEDDGESSNEDGTENECSKLTRGLCDWALRNYVPQNTLSDLLGVLRELHPNLPKQARTLLQTARIAANVKNIKGGEYVHFGILTYFQAIPAYVLHNVSETIGLQINVDGLPLYKSSALQLWPILGKVPFEKEPFVIGMFCGKTKPLDLDEFLYDFVEEVAKLENGFEVAGKTFTLKIDCFICDSPARSFLKNTKGHNGYFGCERCTQEGVYVKNHMTFPEKTAVLRTDDQFLNKEDEDHHKGNSPLTQINVAMVTMFILDYMHLVCLGVTRKLIRFWMKGDLCCRLGSQAVKAISARLVQLTEHIPVEFQRKPRSLSEIDRWKATEYRQFLLYTGPIVLQDILSSSQYKNFMNLSIAMYLMLSPALCKYYCDFADTLMTHFLNEFEQLYGADEIVYNVHNLSHLADDVRRYGALDGISAFPFENYMRKLKKICRKPQFVLQQIHRHITLERAFVTPKKNKNPDKTILKIKHTCGPTIATLPHCTQYKKAIFELFCVATTVGNNCVMVQGNLGLVQNILCDERTDTNYIIFRRFLKLDSLHSSPLDSKDIGFYKASNLESTNHVHLLSDITKKYVLIPMTSEWAAIPLLHSN
ncbi:hypothetical protein ACEWY4_021475 [Coilia grayii]|uniref:Transposase domain-containing protein n=1 Tax=Coilia grayii TaxID=363190 RepID=A0ABD1J972_9TELE